MAKRKKYWKMNMLIPEKELIKLGFGKFSTNEDFSSPFYETKDGFILEEVHKDGSVDLEDVLEVYVSIGKMKALDCLQKRIQEAIKEVDALDD